VTARWVVDAVAPERDLHIVWQPISLLFKNEPPVGSDYYAPAKHTHDLMRVMESVRAVEGDDAVFPYYWEAAARIHNDGHRDVTAAEILDTVGLDPSHAAAYDDPTWDPVIRERMDAGLALVGTDVGTPIISFPGPGGSRTGIFGPVITRVPSGEEAVTLWDAMVTMSLMDGFWELKRTRTERPDFGERPHIG
jgi:hypothetical protein